MQEPVKNRQQGNILVVILHIFCLLYLYVLDFYGLLLTPKNRAGMINLQELL